MPSYLTPTKILFHILLLANLLLANPAKATICGVPDEIGILGISADSTKAKVTWVGSDPACHRTHYNVAWAGGGGRIQREAPISRSSDTWVGGRVKGAVYTVSLQACTKRTAASSRCGPWVSKKFVSCGTIGLPCGHPRLDAPEPMNILAESELCLDVHAPDQARNGGRVQVWACNGSPQQTWVLDKEVGAVISLAGKCLDVQAARTGDDGTPVQVWDCNQLVQQRWHQQHVEKLPDDRLDRPVVLRNDGGKCLDVHAPDRSNNGAKVQVWGCNNSKQQKWEVTPAR